MIIDKGELSENQAVLEVQEGWGEEDEVTINVQSENNPSLQESQLVWSLSQLFCGGIGDEEEEAMKEEEV